MLLDQLGEIREGDVSVPDLLGIDDHGDAVLALIETAGVVRADRLGQPDRLQLELELVAHLDAALGFAAALRMALGTLVGAHEDVSLETRHLAEAYHPWHS